MNQGILYGVGVGPGDPELLTLKSARLLREADVIAVPDKGAGEQTALNIIGQLAQGKPLLHCSTPMTRDQAVLDRCHDGIAREIADILDQGKNVVFITLGDPTVYSTYIYIHKRVLALGYRAELVPGVPSFCAVAARLGTSLCEGSERLLIVPASHKDLSDCLDLDANLVFMKAGRSITELQDRLRERGMLSRASMVANCGMEGEQVWQRFEEMQEPSGYFSIVLVKEGT